jgi:hypothetical protein
LLTSAFLTAIFEPMLTMTKKMMIITHKKAQFVRENSFC